MESTRLMNVNVPILNQPFAFKSWFPTVLITCGCDASTPLLIIGNAIASCSCGRRFAIKRIEFDRMTGRLDVEMGLVADQPAPLSVL